MIRSMEISSESVYRCDTSQIERVLRELEDSPEYVRTVQGTIVIVFPDFEQSEVVFLDPEVKSFIRRAHERVKHLFYYLCPKPEAGALLAFLAVNAPEDDVSIENGEVSVKNYSPELVNILLDRLINTAKFAENMADDWNYIVLEIIKPLNIRFRQFILEQVAKEMGS